jgi:prepilin-type N-terminal cleavage/methylation domain-containing protein/prepilin-type processing-associated H-X9-DG protein
MAPHPALHFRPVKPHLQKLQITCKNNLPAPNPPDNANRMQRQPPTPRAFSLVELLVVISIIALLAAIAVPAIRGAQEKGQRAKCAANMKSIGAGIHLYAAENNGKLPSINCITPDTTWIEQLQSHLGTNYTRVRVSPADPRAAGKLADAHATSYLLNERVEADSFVDESGQPVPGEVVFDRLSRIPEPSRAILMFLGNTNKTSTGTDHIHSGVMTSWSGVRGEIWPDAFGGGSPEGTRGSANYLFADGHVQTIAATALKERVESGHDITVSF